MAVLRLEHALRQLREELARIDYLIRLLEDMDAGKSRRGRPPKFLARPPSNRHTSASAPRRRTRRAPKPDESSAP